MTSITRFLEDELGRVALRADGPVVDVELHLDCPEGPCEPVTGKALVDTGADRTAVDFTSLDERAMPTGMFWGQGVTSETIAMPAYDVRVRLDADMPEVEIERAAATPHLRSQGLVALLGRDVLEEGDLTYHGRTGEWSFVLPKVGTEIGADVDGGFGENELRVRPMPNFALGALAVGVLGGLAVALLWPKPECPPCVAGANADSK